MAGQVGLTSKLAGKRKVGGKGKTPKLKQIFDEDILKASSAEIEITDDQLDAAREWIDMIKSGVLEDETENYDNFKMIVLERILGYGRREVKVTGSKPGRNPDFSIGGNKLCIEVKGTGSGLFEKQHRPDRTYETPITQTHFYRDSGSYQNAICSNYRDFALLGRSSRYHTVDFLDMDLDGGIDITVLREFVFVFSKWTLVEKDAHDKLIGEYMRVQDEITDKFYDLFHEARWLMICEFERRGMGKKDAVEHAQIILNRMVFIFYVEDMEMIGTEHILRDGVLEKIPGATSKSTDIWRYIYERLFVYFKEGREGIHKFNGGLFLDDIPDVGFNDLSPGTGKVPRFPGDKKLDTLMKDHPKTNRIISRLLEMEIHKFDNEHGPKLLGRIFEKSMSDLEKIVKGDPDISRKKVGAYYTPENVTSYICRNSIIPALSKSGNATTAEALLYEYSRDGSVGELEEKFVKLRILDLSCGSGAFLTKAVDVMLEIYDLISRYHESEGTYEKGGTITMDKFGKEAKIRQIIEQNIYGMDVNENAVKIARLSLYFKLVTTSEPLPTLSSKIVAGNSLIKSRDKVLGSGDPMTAFSEILMFGGFDVILGNPPYVEDRKSNITYPKMMERTKDCGNTYAWFIERGLELLKVGGRLGYIVPVSATSTERMRKLQDLLVEECSSLRLSHYDDRPAKLFKDLEDCRSTIMLATRGGGECSISTTGYKRWYADDIGGLFKDISYVDGVERDDAFIPKIANETELAIFEKLRRHPKLKESIPDKRPKGSHVLYYHDAPRYWTRAMDFIPYFRNKGGVQKSSHNKELYFRTASDARIVTAAINSSLFYWFFIKSSNCRDLAREVVGRFRLRPSDVDPGAASALDSLVSRLMDDYRVHSRRKSVGGGVRPCRIGSGTSSTPATASRSWTRSTTYSQNTTGSRRRRGTISSRLTWGSGWAGMLARRTLAGMPVRASRPGVLAPPMSSALSAC